MTLPNPPVPADLDLTKFPFMPLDVRRLRDSDLALESDPEVFKAAVLLWCASWHQVPASSLPNCDRKLAKLAGYGDNLKRWNRVKSAALRGFFEANDGRIYHEVVAEKAREAHSAKLRGSWTRECARLKKAAQRAEQRPVLPTFDAWLAHYQATGDEHWSPPPVESESPGLSLGTNAGQKKGRPEGVGGDKEKDKGEGQGQGLSIGSGGAAGGAPPPPPPGPPPPPPAQPAAKRGARLDPEWKLPKAWGVWAMEQGMTEDQVRTEAMIFRNHWVSKSGKDAAKLDWEATWQNWVLRFLKDHPPARGPAPGGHPRAGDIGAIHDANLAATDEARRLRPDLFPE